MKIISFLLIILPFYINAQDVAFTKIEQGYALKGAYRTYIYSSTDEQSKTTIRINQYKLSILEESEKWLSVKYHIDDTHIAYGYIKKDDVFIESYYLGGNETLNISPVSWNNYNKQFIASIRDFKTREIIDSTLLLNHHHGERFLEIPYLSGLKNVKKTIRFQTYRESCPGLTQNDYVIVTDDNKILTVISEVSTGEIGWESEVIYLPVKFGNGTIKHLFFDYEGKIIDYDSGELTELKNTKSFNIPLDQLIIKKQEYGNPVIKNDDYLMDENDEYVIDVTSKTIVYRWNGNELIEVNKN